MKLNEIINAQPALQKMTTLELPIGAAIKVLKMCKDTAVHVEAFQAKQKKLFEKYGEADPETEGRLVIKDEHTEVFTKEINKVLATEIELEFEKVPVVDFGEATLTVADLNRIEWFIE